jgi:hypothetical protein
VAGVPLGPAAHRADDPVAGNRLEHGALQDRGAYLCQRLVQRRYGEALVQHRLGQVCGPLQGQQLSCVDRPGVLDVRSHIAEQITVAQVSSPRPGGARTIPEGTEAFNYVTALSTGFPVGIETCDARR